MDQAVRYTSVSSTFQFDGEAGLERRRREPRNPMLKQPAGPQRARFHTLLGDAQTSRCLGHTYLLNRSILKNSSIGFRQRIYGFFQDFLEFLADDLLLWISSRRCEFFSSPFLSFHYRIIQWLMAARASEVSIGLVDHHPAQPSEKTGATLETVEVFHRPKVGFLHNVLDVFMAAENASD